MEKGREEEEHDAEDLGEYWLEVDQDQEDMSSDAND